LVVDKFGRVPFCLRAVSPMQPVTPQGADQVNVHGFEQHAITASPFHWIHAVPGFQGTVLVIRAG
jgi:hypothetical protein